MDLAAPIEEVKGIGPKTAEVLHKAGIFMLRDLIYHLPRDYENFQQAQNIADLKPGKVTVKARVESINTRRVKGRLTLTEATLRDKTGAIKAIWFNQPYRAKQFSEQEEYLFSGTMQLSYGRYQLQNSSAVKAEDYEAPDSDKIQPIYPMRGTIKSQDFKKFIHSMQNNIALVPDMIPNWPGRADALLDVHFPETVEQAKKGREYLAVEELFSLLLAARLNREENQKLHTAPIKTDMEAFKNFVAKLPFKLTNAQRLATWEIIQDMNNEIPMNRLLQGDVGSGKTMVAAMAACNAILGGAQVALLAPTAILATQHFESLSKRLENYGVKVALLTGATKKKDALKSAIKSGEINLVIGTHALLTDDTEFKNLGLVVIDEQHRFGVEQRQKLLLKSPHGLAPHFLAMTATPIPRSLQLTVFGDLDVSILNELPKGRQPITTKILAETSTRESLYPKIRETITAGQQIYWICKAIDDNPSSEATSVKSRTEKLKKVFPDYTIEFLHGRMKPAEKDTVMERFASGEIQILVSTTVVEVGVDVPNSTLMIIENAENYGLAQLHQLRGRVGRGSVASFCYLLTTSDNQPTRRLRELEKSTDGFYLAEVDLKLRGPGEIYGALQHGALDLRIATFSDTKLIKQARDDTEVFLKKPENMLKYKELMSGIKRYQQLTTLN